jgi:hypothetical protein
MSYGGSGGAISANCKEKLQSIMIAIVDEAFSMTYLGNSYTKGLVRNWLKYLYLREIVELFNNLNMQKLV